ncbi:MAG: C-type lectin domain-containing protein, partial [Flavobacteriaceae bacterium]|nr:C-type lectin domain-containing protein [Flavobacteriaceae bacterium]
NNGGNRLEPYTTYTLSIYAKKDSSSIEDATFNLFAYDGVPEHIHSNSEGIINDSFKSEDFLVDSSEFKRYEFTFTTGSVVYPIHSYNPNGGSGPSYVAPPRFGIVHPQAADGTWNNVNINFFGLQLEKSSFASTLVLQRAQNLTPYEIKLNPSAAPYNFEDTIDTGSTYAVAMPGSVNLNSTSALGNLGVWDTELRTTLYNSLIEYPGLVDQLGGSVRADDLVAGDWLESKFSDHGSYLTDDRHYLVMITYNTAEHSAFEIVSDMESSINSPLIEVEGEITSFSLDSNNLQYLGQYDGHSYFYLTTNDQIYDWQSLLSLDTNSLDAYLAQFETEAEYNAVKQIIIDANIGNDWLWLGGYKDQVTKELKWFGPMKKPILLGQNGGHTYLWSRMVRNYDDHTTFANGLGAYLFNPNSEYEQEFLKTQYGAITRSSMTDDWTTSQETAWIGIDWDSSKTPEGYYLSESNDINGFVGDSSAFKYAVQKISPNQTFVISYKREITLEDMNKSGGYSNSVTFTASNTGVSDVSDDGDDTDGNTEDDPTIVNFDIETALEVKKDFEVVDNNANNIIDSGDTINYTIKVENTGNLTLYNLEGTDNLSTAGSFDPTDPTLVPVSRDFGNVKSIASVWANQEPNSAYNEYSFYAYYWSGSGTYHFDDQRYQNSLITYVAESDDPNLTSLSNFTHLGTFEGHNYFLSTSAYYWTDARQNAEGLSEVYMQIVDSMEEFAFVRNILDSQNTQAWVGLKRDANTSIDGWYWIGKDDDDGGSDYDVATSRANGYNDLTNSNTATHDNIPFFWTDQSYQWPDYGTTFTFSDPSEFDGQVSPGEIITYTTSYTIEPDAVTNGDGHIYNSATFQANSPANQDTTTFDVSDDSDGDGDSAADSEADTDTDPTNDPTDTIIPHLEVLKTSSVDDTNGVTGIGAGDTITYTIEVNNKGGETLTGITLADTLTDADGKQLLLDNVQQNQTVQLGTRTAVTTQHPVSTQHEFSYTQSLITKDKLSDLKTVRELVWYTDDSFNLFQKKSDHWQIYLALTTKGSYTSNTDWVPFSEFTKVYDADVNVDYVSDTTTSVQTLQDPIDSSRNLRRIRVTLDKPFILDETSNLVIAVVEAENGDDGTAANENYYYSDQSDFQTIGYIGSNIDFDNLDTSPPSATYYVTRLNDIDIIGQSDDGLTFSSSTGTSTEGTLTPGESATYTATYTIDQSTFDSSAVNNDVTATGSFAGIDGNTETIDASLTSPTTDTFTQSPRATITKTVKLVDNGDGFDGVDDVLVYDIVVTNTGNVTLNNINISDDLIDFADQSLTITSGPTFTLNGSVGISAANIDQLSHVFSGQPNGQSHTDMFELISEAKTYEEARTLALIRGGYLYKGQHWNPDNSDATYNTNEQELMTKILDKLSDRGIDLSSSSITEEDPDASASKAYLWANGDDIEVEGTWNRTWFDGDKIPIDFNGYTATSSGFLNDLNDQDALAWSLTSPHELNDVDKDNQLFYVIQYQSNDLSWIGSGEGTLAPGESALYKVSFAINQQAVNTGGVKNQATLTATAPDGATLNIDSDDPTTSDVDDTTDYEIIYPEIEVIKTVDDILRDTDNDGTYETTVSQGSVAVGDKIKYTITATNTGNWPLENIQITDTVIDSNGDNQEALTPTLVSVNGVLVSTTPFGGTLSSNDVLAYMVEYVIKSSSANAAFISNSATVSGDAMVDVDGTPTLFATVSDDSDDGLTGDDDTGDDATEVNLAPDPKMVVLKTVIEDDGADNELNATDVLTYTITIENTGNLPLNNFSFDDKIYNQNDELITSLTLQFVGDAMASTPNDPLNNGSGYIVPGEIETWSTQYTLTQDDVNKGGVYNTVTATASSPDNTDDVTVTSDGDGDLTVDTDGDTDPTNDPTETIIAPNPILEVTKTARVENVWPSFVSFGAFEGTNQSNWTHSSDNKLNDGFITSKGISKPGEYFEFHANGSRDFRFAIVNTNEFSIDDIKDFMDTADQENVVVNHNKFAYFGAFYEENKDHIKYAGRRDLDGSTANATIIYPNGTENSSYIVDELHEDSMRSVSRVRIGIDINGKPTIWTYSKYPEENNKANLDTSYDPTIEFVREFNLDNVFDPNGSYHFIYQPVDSNIGLDELKMSSYSGGVVGDKIVYDITVENKGNVTLTNLEI